MAAERVVLPKKRPQKEDEQGAGAKQQRLSTGLGAGKSSTRSPGCVAAASRQAAATRVLGTAVSG